MASEEALAERVAYERERRGWTYESLAARMTAVGCPINQSALYKIEKGEPRRRITVDELVAFSEVTRIPVEQLLLPPGLASTRRFGELLSWADEARETFRHFHGLLQQFVSAHPDWSNEQIERLVQSWAKHLFADGQQRDRQVDYWVLQLVNDDERRSALIRRFEEKWGPVDG